ncbi:MAG TPA: hypothetical protein VHY22_13650, partial [Chthoniobacteraceae bacterium]|nr:hypothetical protein [Chthoniobacteraceae bacterium]
MQNQKFSFLAAGGHSDGDVPAVIFPAKNNRNRGQITRNPGRLGDIEKVLSEPCFTHCDDTNFGCIFDSPRG